MMTDPVADMLTRIRNAVAIERPHVDIPTSKLKVGIAEALQREGYIWDYELIEAEPRNVLRLNLKYGPNGERVIPEDRPDQQARPAGLRQRQADAGGAQRDGRVHPQHQQGRALQPRGEAGARRRRDPLHDLLNSRPVPVPSLTDPKRERGPATDGLAHAQAFGFVARTSPPPPHARRADAHRSPDFTSCLESVNSPSRSPTG